MSEDEAKAKSHSSSMTLNLTEEQKEYFDKSGIIDSRTLQRVFEQSVKDQEKLKQQAAKIRKAQK